jgi:hypothetical protein
MDCRQRIAGDLFHLELVLKVQPFLIAAPAKPVRLRIGIASDASGCDRFIRFLPGPERSVRSRRKRTLLSFQRPALLTA